MIVSPPFFRDIVNARQCYILGNKGTGKTVFSVALTYHLLTHSMVSSAVGNFPCALFTVPPSPFRHTCVVVDEVGLYLDSRLSYRSKELTLLLSSATVFLRKVGNFLLLPTFIEGDSRMRAGSVRVFRSKVNRLFWLYRCEYGESDSMERRPGVNFFSYPLFLFFPGRYFSLFNTHYLSSGSLGYDLLSLCAPVPPVHK